MECGKFPVQLDSLLANAALKDLALGSRLSDPGHIVPPELPNCSNVATFSFEEVASPIHCYGHTMVELSGF
jgi:hypothetical protein